VTILLLLLLLLLLWSTDTWSISRGCCQGASESTLRHCTWRMSLYWELRPSSPRTDETVEPWTLQEDVGRSWRYVGGFNKRSREVMSLVFGFGRSVCVTSFRFCFKYLGMILTLERPVVLIHLLAALIVHEYHVLYASENKPRLFPCLVLNYWLFYCAVRTEFLNVTGLFRFLTRVRKIAKGDYYFCRVCPFFVLPRGTAGLPPDRLCWNLIYELFPKIFGEN
jgi:hypothetical protein